MTALQQLMRKDNKLHKATSKSKSSPLMMKFKTRMQAILYRNQRREARVHNDDDDDDDNNNEAPLAIDVLCEHAMRCEVEHYLVDHGGAACAMVDVINALLGSTEVSTRFAAAHSNSSSNNSFRETMAHSFQHRNARKMAERRYRLTNALRKLQKVSSMVSRRVRSWPEAKEALETGLAFAKQSAKHKQQKQSDDYTSSALTVRQTNKDEIDDHNSILSQSLRKLSLIKVESQIEQARNTTVSSKLWRRVSQASIPQASKSNNRSKLGGDRADCDLESYYRDRLEAYQNRDSAAVTQVAELMAQEQERKAREQIAQMMRPLTESEAGVVKSVIYGMSGADDEVVAESDTITVQRRSMRSLAPGQWLNDEVISFFLYTLSKRDESMCRDDPGRKRSHFFNSFFITKLFDEGNQDPSKDGKYNYKNVKRWSKKVPGKNIFNLNCIVCPVNVGNVHWTCAVIFMEEKRIQFYDSMGDSGMHYVKGLFQYVQDEHEAKQGGPLPDADAWQLVGCTSDTPRQLNGFDCGVFTCMFADFLSKGCPLLFDQTMVTQCRERIALAIMNGTAIV